ncbi:MAG: helicase-exonuclease AddAB subunit AddB [Clostridia bacterium]|nr:helicase-exonuclease AddAB subunit AddB [Clostridia bacterium]
MGLRLVYGKSGTGKSTYIFNEIKEKINDESKIYIITPEQFSFTAERELLNVVGTGAALNAEVLTFNRMAHRVMAEVGGNTKTALSGCGKAMLIYNILLNEKERLNFLGKSDENIELISTQITEFKKHGVSIENLDDIIDKSEDKYLKSKMADMRAVYSKFEETIKNKYIDENDVLTILAEQLPNTNIFENTLIYIDEFVGFTKQEYDIIAILLNQAKQVTINVCSDSLEQSNSPDTDIFYANKLTVKKIMDVANSVGAQVDSPVYMEDVVRFNNSELRHLERNLYAVPYSQYNNEEVQNIKLFLANNPYSEIENIAENIVKLVKNQGYRYKDISIITKNLDTYSNLCKVIFNKYQIPVFIDEKKDLSQNIIVKYLLSILEIFSKNWSYESVFNYVKTGFLDITREEIYALENYCLKWGIKYSKWYKGDWNFHDEDDSNREQIARFRELRGIIVNPLLKFKENLVGTNSAKELTMRLYNFLIENEIDRKLEQKKEELIAIGKTDVATEYETSWKIIVQVLDEIVLVFGDDKISFDRYMQILKTGLGNSDLGKIPGTQDQVIMGDIDRSRSHKIKTAFIIGLNDGMFPSVNKNEGYFNDKDREYLKDEGIELAKGTVERMYEDNFNIYKAFTSASDNVNLSYSSSSSDGKTLRASMLVSKVKRIFPGLKEESDIIEKKYEILTENTTFEELLNKIRDYRDDGEELSSEWVSAYNYYMSEDKWKYKLISSLKALNYTNIPDKIDKENVDSLYGKTLKTSVSRLEQYRACPFSYYLKYGLNLSEKDTLKVDSLDTGTFMHDTIDTFFNKIRERNIKIHELEDDEIDSIIEEIISEKLGLDRNFIFSATPKYKVLSERLTRVVKRSMKYIIDSIKYSKFDVLGNEVEFKEGKDYAPITLDLDDGRKVEITGKIDRIDIAEDSENKYIRIIDYKSSYKNIELNSVYAGLQIQLLTYLDAVCKEEEVNPAGVLYFNLIDPIIKSEKNMTEEEIENEIRKKFKMQGLILADVNVVKMMDTKLESGASSVVPAYISAKDGELSQSKTSGVSRKQFEYLQKYMNKIIKQISEEIMSGNIDINPYYKKKKTPCEFCKYKAICGFDTGNANNKYNYINEMEKNAVLEMIKEEVEE